ncbi:MAG: hypothetical protein DRQ58_11550 [Gammaproteobacteria bacterium]|nr:MAG: hypothetical protein DRQ58_11550 [Gammaproteobacteria bacterium]
MAVFQIHTTSSHIIPNIRKEVVPDEALGENIAHNMHYMVKGLPDQRRICLSDVIEYEGGLYLVRTIGFLKITQKQYDGYLRLDHDDRIQACRVPREEHEELLRALPPKCPEDWNKMRALVKELRLALDAVGDDEDE